MTERVESLGAYVERISRCVDDDAMSRCAKAAGFAGKDAGLAAVVADLGPDRAMSNFKSGKVALSVGFDQGVKRTEVVIKHGPVGLWWLVTDGRKASGPIYPKKQSKSSGRKYARGTGAVAGRALKTPQGFRSASSFSKSRGLGTFRRAAAHERRDAPAAGFKQLQVEIPRALKGGR